MTNNSKSTEIFKTEETELLDTLIAVTIVMRKIQVQELFQQEEAQDFIID